jgi:meso-butanediol dehydrogenase/(S,S)-butanediol dehydrogenase/diacetyl reductase
MSRLAGKSAIVTGAAQGIGEEIATRLAAEGAKVAVADLNFDKAQAVAERLKRSGAEAIAVQVDVAERAQMRAAVEATVAAFGRLDILFNNAGFNKPLPFMEVDEANFNAIMRVNAWGVMVGAQEAARHAGGRPADDQAGSGRQDHQHGLDRRTAGLCGICALLRQQGFRHLVDPGRRARIRQTQDHRQRFRPRRGRHAAVGRS